MCDAPCAYKVYNPCQLVKKFEHHKSLPSSIIYQPNSYGFDMKMSNISRGISVSIRCGTQLDVHCNSEGAPTSFGLIQDDVDIISLIPTHSSLAGSKAKDEPSRGCESGSSAQTPRAKEKRKRFNRIVWFCLHCEPTRGAITAKVFQPPWL